MDTNTCCGTNTCKKHSTLDDTCRRQQ
jgi:hypothetical protein